MTTKADHFSDAMNHRADHDIDVVFGDINHLSDAALVAETKRVAGVARRVTAELVALLAEVERRGVHWELGYSSMFAYCTRLLHLSEQSAYNRIAAARTARRFPRVLDLLIEGALTLSSVDLLAPHLTDETVEWMLEAASGKSTREVEKLIAAWRPQPDLPTTLRALPSAGPGREASSPGPLLGAEIECDREAERSASVTEPASGQAVALARSQPRAIVAPIAPTRYLLKVTIGDDTHDKLQRARALLRHSIPDGDIDQILNRALSLLIDDVVRTKCASTSKPRRTGSAIGRSRGRHIPAAVKREVWRRDGGRCVFAGEHGLCGETAFLEYHHVVPFAAGGLTDVGNLQLRCRAHNAHEARYSARAELRA
jgi:5-methylcytosine-specific restriction endonuclease McrA